MAPASAPTIAQRLPPALRTPRAEAACASRKPTTASRPSTTRPSDADWREVRRDRVDERPGEDQRRARQQR